MGLRAGPDGAEIFFGNLERGEKDGHFGAHEGGDKRVLTGKSGSREWRRQAVEGGGRRGEVKDRAGIHGRRAGKGIRW